jgi:mannose-6-phosphate isomerase-like protein (cupin superfamily)
MQQVFRAVDWLQVPDTTWLSPFLNAKDVNSGLDSELLGEFSLAMGQIRPGQPSRVHVHPLSTQVTMVLEGTLDIRMRNPSRAPYTVHLEPDQAALVEPGTFLQLVNPGDATSRVLYVVGPAYVFEQRGEEVVYDDSIALPQEWEEIAAGSAEWLEAVWRERSGFAGVDEMRAAREAALSRLDGAQSAST